MEYRSLGRSALKVSPLCFGGNVFGWTADERTSFSLLDAWVDAGFNFIDTADVYSRWAPGHAGGESEAVIGRWLKQGGRRDQVVIATKVGNDMGEGRTGLKAARIREAVEASLRRLQVDCIDLYQAHSDDAATPLQETLEAFARLVEQGKVRVLGASNYTAARLAEALRVSESQGLPRYESLQPLYNLYDREVFEAELQPLCEREQVGVINYYALAAGFLSGKYRAPEDAAKSPRGAGVVKKYLNERGKKILAALDAAAQETGSTPGQVAIAWVMAQPAVTSPIASATSAGTTAGTGAGGGAETAAARDASTRPGIPGLNLVMPGLNLVMPGLNLVIPGLNLVIPGLTRDPWIAGQARNDNPLTAARSSRP